MLLRAVGPLLLVASLVIGCATRAKPPPIQVYELGMWRASYRDYTASRQSICSAEPRWLIDELGSVNGVLSRWLGKTDLGLDEVWPKEALDLLEQGAETLPPLIAVHREQLQEVGRCSFANEGAFPDIRRRGLEYVEKAAERIERAPQVKAYIAAKAALEVWRRERPLREIEAGRTCPAKVRVGQARVYYAFESEEGQRRWLFCDGARVTTDVSGALVFQAPPDATRREMRRIKARDYLEAAKAFPLDRMDIPPRLPSIDVAQASGKDES